MTETPLKHAERIARETPNERSERIARDPLAASDSDQLRYVADYLDLIDRKMGIPPHEHDVQDFLRGLAVRLELRAFVDAEGV